MTLSFFVNVAGVIPGNAFYYLIGFLAMMRSNKTRCSITDFFSYLCVMNVVSYHTSIIKVGKSKGIRIPEDYLEALGKEVVLEKTKEGVLIRPAHEVAPLEDWDKLFTMANVAPEPELKEWDITLGDGIK
jgi:antitoxin component of MazEF toxin-antitoxin module